MVTYVLRNINFSVVSVYLIYFYFNELCIHIYIYTISIDIVIYIFIFIFYVCYNKYVYIGLFNVIYDIAKSEYHYYTLYILYTL